MGSSGDFWAAYKDPRWQKKRLEIMAAADFKCYHCGRSDVTLNVHHGYYEKGRRPWEYPDSSLACLCEPCHERSEDRLLSIRKLMGTWHADGLDQVYGYVLAQYLMCEGSTRIVLDTLTMYQIFGFAEAFQIDLGQVRDLVRYFGGHPVRGEEISKALAFERDSVFSPTQTQSPTNPQPTC